MANVINLDPTTWNRQDWTDAYNAHCATAKQPLSKKEYYATVMANAERLKSGMPPLSEGLRNKWANGWNNAVVWAKNRKCNINGVALENCRPEINLEDLQNDVRDLEWEMSLKR